MRLYAFAYVSTAETVTSRCELQAAYKLVNAGNTEAETWGEIVVGEFRPKIPFKLTNRVFDVVSGLEILSMVCPRS